MIQKLKAKTCALVRSVFRHKKIQVFSISDEVTPGFARLEFDYPFDIGLPDASYPVTLEGGKAGVVGITRHEGIQIFDKGRMFRARNNEAAEWKLKRTRRFCEEHASMRGEYGSGAKFQIDASEGARALFEWHFTTVTIAVPVNDIRLAWSPPHNQIYVNDLCEALFNIFLNAYRDAAVDVRAPLLSLRTSAFYKLLFVSPLNEEEKNGGTDLFELLSETHDARNWLAYPMGDKTVGIPLVGGTPHPPLSNNHPKPMMRISKVRTFMLSLMGVNREQLHDRFLLSGMERDQLGSDYRVSVIDFAVAVESATVWACQQLWDLLGRDRAELDSLLDYSNSDRSYQSPGARMNRIDELALEAYRAYAITPLSIVHSDEYEDWSRDVRAMRNLAAHEGPEFDADVSRRAFESAQKIVRNIEKIIRGLKAKQAEVAAS